ncbi:AAA family ATPase [Variovorax sp. 770b2]|uniref:AAA family ATPase n=1 Tax=Variovorax sp. 770b2 TaxID=1566271 RepID=UPI000B89027C|nr:AAA family ATPase [Variovorax sp. 770b2]
MLLGKNYKPFRVFLGDVFENKCCYCESLLGSVADGEMDRFRPRMLYPQLAADWRNLYLACPSCARSKARRFPVVEQRSEGAASYSEILASEAPLLLDPCAEDPAIHLSFTTDGEAVGLTERGRTTVNVLALNRVGLMLARRQQMRIAQSADRSEQRKMLGPGAPYSAAVRTVVGGDEGTAAAPKDGIAISIQRSSEQALSQIDTEKGEGLENYRFLARYVERLRIENFGPIRLLDLDLSAPHSPQGPCFALLGENGVGKSTVLRALAMALSGKNYIKRLRLTSNRLLARNSYSGEVRVRISGQSDELVMTMRRNKSIEFSSTTSSSLVLAYGATRLLPRRGHRPKQGLRHAKIDNLFDPFLPLTDPISWLSRLEAKRLTEVNTVLASLLPSDQQLQLVRDEVGAEIRFVVGGDPARSIADLSDGYQSMLGMATDIMEVMYSVYDSLQEAQGVVLIDELGNHFHPSWRIACVSALRQAFPFVQFIYSTHDPLCLRGLHAGEVAVLRRDRLGQIYAMENLPPVDKLRVEQLLTSEHFGMNSTLDPAMEKAVKEYEVLLGKSARTQEEEQRLTELVAELTDAKYLGSTRRERLALQLVDYEGDSPAPASSSIDAAALSQSTLSKLRRLMTAVEPTQEKHDQG